MSSLITLDSCFDILDYFHEITLLMTCMTSLKKISKNLGTCILDLFLMLKYNHLGYCFSILLDHAYVNKHDLI